MTHALFMLFFGAFSILMSTTHNATTHEMVDLALCWLRVFGTLRANSYFDKANKYRNTRMKPYPWQSAWHSPIAAALISRLHD